MLKRINWRVILVAFVFTLIPYVYGYFFLRSEHVIIHYAGYAGSPKVQGRAVAQHRLGRGSGESGFGNFVDEIGLLVYHPAMRIEESYWRWRHPEGEAWPY